MDYIPAELIALSTDRLRELYDALPATEREALDQVIMDQGITDLESLLHTMDMVKTYFKEQ